MSTPPFTASHRLHQTLLDLQSHPAPILPSPSSTPKRASVAVILRLNPHPDHPPPTNPPTATSLTHFFSHPWTLHADPELLFIRRSSRPGDRWTSHVAFPGGKRDPSDTDDLSTAIRETSEEIGLDISSSSSALYVGHLPDRIIKTSWGTVPLMTLSPHVFLLTDPHPPHLKLQQSEVASAHWVPWRTLFDPVFRTVERCDVADRLAAKWGKLGRWVMGASVGEMEFAAVRLWPSWSCWASFGGDFEKEGREAGSKGGSGKGRGGNKELRCWGVTLAVVEDLLEMEEGGVRELWRWPTFTMWDIRAVIWGWSRGVRRRGVERVERAMGERPRGEKGEKGMEESLVLVQGEEGDGMGEQVVWDRESSVEVFLKGYYEVVRRAVWTTLLTRMVVTGVVGVAVWRRLRR